MNRKTFIIVILLAAFGSLTGVLINNQLSSSKEEDAIVTSEAPESIGWEKARQLLADCKIAGASQAHSLDVSLTDINAKTYVTQEPAIDDLFKEVAKHEDRCETPIISTE